MINKKQSRCLFATLLSVLAPLSAIAADVVKFPDKAAKSVSPDGACTIKSVDPTVSKTKAKNNTEEPAHQLVISRKGQKKDAVLYPYGRSVDVMWSPDSKAFIVDDWAVSNMAMPYLFRIDDLAHHVDIAAKLTASVKDKDDKHTLANAGHLYIFASKWISPNLLEIKAAGHNGKAFTLTYTWDLKNTFTRTKSENEESVSRDGKAAN